MPVASFLRRLLTYLKFCIRFRTFRRVAESPDASNRIFLCGHDSILSLPRFCPHHGADLLKSHVTHDHLVCHWHGCRFDRADGKILAEKRISEEPPLVLHRVTSSPASLDIVWNNVQDYTHFAVLHKKYFTQFDVLFDDGTYQAFYYTSRFYPLPILSRFIAIRKLDRKNHIIRQVYKNLSSKQLVYFKLWLEQDRGSILTHNLYVTRPKGLVSKLPGPIARFINSRLHRMWEEDMELQMGRVEVGGFDRPACQPDLGGLHRELDENFDEILSRLDAKPYEFSAGLAAR